MKSSESYILFIDESGKSKLSDRGTHFLLSGLIINQDLHTALSSYMVSLKNKSGISIDENIHAFDLFEGERARMRGKDGRIMKDQKGKMKHRRIPFSSINIFFERLTYLIAGADVRCLVFRMNKTYYANLIKRIAKKHKVADRFVTNYLGRRNLNDFLYESLVRKMILEFGHFLEKEDAYGEVVAESRRQDDEGVLRAFIVATNDRKYSDDSHYRLWAKCSFKRIHSLILQNKKGLSFGLEIADLFGWAHFNKQYGRKFPISSVAKQKRVESRLAKVDKLMQALYHKNKPEDMTRNKIKTVAEDKVSEFTEVLSQFKAPSVSSGTPPGNPGGPYKDNTG